MASAARSVSVGYRTPSALHGLRVVQRVDRLGVAEVRMRDDAAIRALRARPGIRWVRRVVPRHGANDPSFILSAVPDWQRVASNVDLVPLWVQHAASSVRIAVVDTGADLAVPALAGKGATTWNVTTSAAPVRDEVGHGTFVASIAAGASIGFGGDAQLMVVQANRGGTGFSDVDEANAIVWAVDHGANIVNLSIGGSETSAVERSAISYAKDRGVLLVAAAGNAALQGNPAQYPAALIGRDGLVVGAADKTGRRAAFSSTGAWLDLLAPGVGVVGALAGEAPGAALFTPLAAASGYATGTGTSYAAPEVAGAAALVWAAAPSLGAAGVAQALEATASGRGSWTADRGFGNVDVAAAVQRALGGPAPAVLPAAKPTTKSRAAGGKRPR